MIDPENKDRLVIFVSSVDELARFSLTFPFSKLTSTYPLSLSFGEIYVSLRRQSIL